MDRCALEKKDAGKNKGSGQKALDIWMRPLKT